MKEGYLFWLIILLTSCTTTHTSSDNILSSPSALRKTSMTSLATLKRDKAIPTFLFDWPVKGQLLYKFQDLKGDVLNKGIDIQAPLGTPVRAAQDGEVSFVSDELKGLGGVIILNHREGFQTVYAHHSQNLVKVGDGVKKNQIIARLGSAGRAAGPYLHFEIRRNHRPVDPFDYLTKNL